MKLKSFIFSLALLGALSICTVNAGENFRLSLKLSGPGIEGKNLPLMRLHALLEQTIALAKDGGKYTEFNFETKAIKNPLWNLKGEDTTSVSFRALQKMYEEKPRSGILMAEHTHVAPPQPGASRQFSILNLYLSRGPNKLTASLDSSYGFSCACLSISDKLTGLTIDTLSPNQNFASRIYKYGIGRSGTSLANITRSAVLALANHLKI